MIASVPHGLVHCREDPSHNVSLGNTQDLVHSLPLDRLLPGLVDLLRLSQYDDIVVLHNTPSASSSDFYTSSTIAVFLQH